MAEKGPDRYLRRRFPRAFGEFSEGKLAEVLHEAMIKKSLEGKLGGHLSRESTAIEARERAEKKGINMNFSKRNG